MRFIIPAWHNLYISWMVAGMSCLILTGSVREAQTAEVPRSGNREAEASATSEEARAPTYAPIRRDPESEEPWLANRPEPQAAVQGEGSASRTISWLVAVVVLAVLVFWGGLHLVKRWLPGGQNLFASPAIEVVGRTHLDPRRYVAMLRVGRRILLLAVSPDEIRPLGEVEDETEVADLLAQARPRTATGRSVFHTLFQRQAAQVDAIQEEAVAEGAAGELDGTLGSLRERVRSLHAGDGDA